MLLNIKKKTVLSVIIPFSTAFIFIVVFCAFASDAMLMFVGEDLEVLSIASKREEAAWSAPAIADVITREDIENRGALTIAQTIDNAAGFHVEKTGRGSMPYLRGIPNSALFLYDTVPVGSGIEKSSLMIDHEISLAPIKRIEIIRGTGSVLWGPDAFAGVVNAVPFTGKDFQGIETGLLYSSDDYGKEAYLKYGTDNNKWNSFLSFSVRSAKEDDSKLDLVNFWNDGITPAPLESRYGDDTPDNSHYLELYYSFSFDDWLTFSAKIADNSKAFSVSDRKQENVWQEKISSTPIFFKLEASRKIDLDSGIRFSGYFSETRLEHEIIDNEFSQKERSVFGELIYDRSFFTLKGLSTLGISGRKDRFDNVPVWKSFFPDYFDSRNLYFLPMLEKKNYDNCLLSVFGQYRHKLKDIEFWTGIRHDNHTEYKDKTSYSSGIAWHLFSDYIIKAIYGTAYRTPFVKQLDEYGGNRLEKIKSANFQIQWKPDKKNKIALTLFRNKIDNHVIADLYEGAGLSTPNSQTIDGLELECDLEISDSFKFSGNATLLENDGPDEMFLYNDYTYIDSEGVEQQHYQGLSHKYDAGADTKINLACIWKLTENIKFIPEIEYFSKRKFYYPLEDITMEYPGEWLCNLNLRFENIIGFNLHLYVNNIFDNRYKIFNSSSALEEESLSVGVILKFKF